MAGLFYLYFITASLARKTLPLCHLDLKKSLFTRYSSLAALEKIKSENVHNKLYELYSNLSKDLKHILLLEKLSHFVTSTIGEVYSLYYDVLPY